MGGVISIFEYSNEKIAFYSPRNKNVSFPAKSYLLYELVPQMRQSWSTAKIVSAVSSYDRQSPHKTIHCHSLHTFPLVVFYAVCIHVSIWCFLQRLRLNVIYRCQVIISENQRRILTGLSSASGKRKYSIGRRISSEIGPSTCLVFLLAALLTTVESAGTLDSVKALKAELKF